MHLRDKGLCLGEIRFVGVRVQSLNFVLGTTGKSIKSDRNSVGL